MQNVGLALQGGGAYAAFTAGALKAMFNGRKKLMRPDNVHSVSGTSGGALNAMLLGLGIHEKLENPTHYIDRLWEINKLENLLKDNLIFPKAIPDELLSFFIGMSRSFSESNPVIANLIREYSRNHSVVNELIDSIIHHAAPNLPKDLDTPLFLDTKPFITVVGTEVKTAQAHYFTNHIEMIEKFRKLNISKKYNVLKELTLRGVYASIAHPYLLSSVTMGEDVYWDGYYTSNPPFFYLFREGCEEVFLIRLIQRNRENIGNDQVSVHDRAEEIVQNTALNMEIQMYYLMRELLVENKRLKKGFRFKLGMNPFNRSSVYHEIRLMKSGNIVDEGYPLSDFVDKLLRMGEKAMMDENGFISTYKKRGDKIGWQVITEIAYENEAVHSYMIHADDFISEENRPFFGSAIQGYVKTKWADIKKLLSGRS